MAKAPKPGERARKQERLDGVRRCIVTCDGKEYPLAFPLATGDQRALRMATGLTVDAFLRSPNGQPAMALDSLSVMLWLARRQNGETNLTLDEVDALVDDIVAAGEDQVRRRLAFEWEENADLDESDPES